MPVESVQQMLETHKQQFQQDCTNRTAELVNFINGILQGKYWTVKASHSFNKAVVLIMEYEYQNFDIFGWLRDGNGDYLTETLCFPKAVSPQFDIDVEDEIYGLKLNEDEEGEAIEAVEDFYDWIQQYFCQWFVDCYRSATYHIHSDLTVYFSVHDTNSYTNLGSMKNELCGEIAQKFGWTEFWQD